MSTKYFCRQVFVRLSVTTLEPGANEVLTQGLRVKPSSTAFLATKPAASITLGLEVLVQLVIAAITTSPLLSSNLSLLAMFTCWPLEMSLLAPFKMDSIDALMPVSGTRSCGR